MENINNAEKQEKKFNPLVLLGVVAVLLVAGIGLSVTRSKNTTPIQSQTDGTAMTTQQTPTSDEMSDRKTTPMQAVEGANDTTQTASNKVAIAVEGGSFYYKPNEIRVKKGQKVTITLTAVDMRHDFNIDELNVHMPDVEGGQKGTVEFTADKTGTYEYYCSVGQHRKNGQIGKLIVE